MPLLLKHPDSSLLRNLKHTKAADKNEWLLYAFLKLNNMIILIQAIPVSIHYKTL